jgi:prepilin-type N-terminal cleavage/methylation domain-containing protein
MTAPGSDRLIGWRSRRLGAGMTLVEVLVAIAIVLLAVTVLASGYVNVLLGYRSVEDTSSIAPDVAFARYQVLRAANREEAERAADTTRPNGEPLRWQATLEETDMADLFRVKLEVELGRPSPEEPLKVEQEFWVFQPAWSEVDKVGTLRDEFRKRIEDGRKGL